MESKFLHILRSKFSTIPIQRDRLYPSHEVEVRGGVKEAASTGARTVSFGSETTAESSGHKTVRFQSKPRKLSHIKEESHLS